MRLLVPCPTVASSRPKDTGLILAKAAGTQGGFKGKSAAPGFLSLLSPTASVIRLSSGNLFKEKNSSPLNLAVFLPVPETLSPPPKPSLFLRQAM